MPSEREDFETNIDVNPLEIEIKREETDEEVPILSEIEFVAELCEGNFLVNSSREVSPKRKVQTTQPLVSEDIANASEVTLHKGGQCEKSSKITTAEQFAVLIEELKNQPEMAKGAPLFGCNRQKWEEKWDAIRRKLNSRGPPIRSTTEWKKVWSDLKSRTKKKLANNAAEVGKAGIGAACLKFLTTTEQEVDRILSSARSILSVDTILQGQKRPYEDLRNKQALSAASTLPVPILPASPLPKRHKPDDDEFLLLLRKQTKTQQQVSNKLDKISDSIDRIAKALELLVYNQIGREADQGT